MRNTNYKTNPIFMVASVAVLLLFSYGLKASTADVFLNRLQGTWQGDGKTLGMPARLQMKWEWVLGGKFLRLSLKNEMQAANRQLQTFEGHAYYQPAGEAKYQGEWFDSRGESFPIKGNIEGDALIALWGAPGKEQGKSVYRLIEAGKLEVIDFVMDKDGAWKEFGRFVMIRQ
jgi:hypothetical protein